ncbi:MAG TPA: hypothetical protein VJ887_02560, partial [Actinomycetota bacterium]|nr:hypothetical protein [Actinomycetota bacterium]
NAPRPSSVPRSDRPAGSTVTTVTPPSGTEGSAQPDRCDDEVGGQGLEGPADEGDPVRAQGCPKDRATSPEGSGSGGKPEDPRSQGEDGGSPGTPPEEPVDLGEDSGPPDDQGEGNGPPDDQGNQGQGNYDQGNQGEGHGPPEQTGDPAPQVEDPSDGQDATSEAVDEAALSDQHG